MKAYVSIRSHTTLASSVLAVAVALGGSNPSADAQVPPPLDHYRMYAATGGTPLSQVTLIDQFQTQTTPLSNVEFFLVPTSKNGEPIFDPVPHLTCYGIPTGSFSTTVSVDNQFRNGQTLTVKQPDLLCVPSEKFPQPIPVPLNRDHYKCYEAQGDPVNAIVTLADQFRPETGVQVVEPFLFCTPVDKNGEGILNPVEHLTCYHTLPPGLPVGIIPIRNQFGMDTLDVSSPVALCVPSIKHWGTPTTTPTETATVSPSTTPSVSPSTAPSAGPTNTPGTGPTNTPGTGPTNTPGTGPSATPTGFVPTCAPTPVPSCRKAEKGLLLLKNVSDDTKDRLIWKWIKGQATSRDEFADPTTKRGYALCIYAGTTPLTDVAVSANSTKWSAISTKGFKYKDATGSEDGIQKVVLKGGAENKAKALMKGKGNNLPDPTLGSIPAPVTAQLVNSDTPVCWETVHSGSDIIKNESDQFKAKR